MDSPVGLALDHHFGARRLFIGDSGNKVIRVLFIRTGVVKTLAGAENIDNIAGLAYDPLRKWLYFGAGSHVHALKADSSASCEHLGWEANAGDFGSALVCSGSYQDPLQGTEAVYDSMTGQTMMCSGELTWDEAYSFCTEVGARMCSVEELRSDEATDSGCMYNDQLVWSSTACGTPHAGGGRWVVPGAAAHNDTLLETCGDAQDHKHLVRYIMVLPQFCLLPPSRSRSLPPSLPPSLSLSL